jgi:hypothetical protein
LVFGRCWFVVGLHDDCAGANPCAGTGAYYAGARSNADSSANRRTDTSA